MSTGFRLEDVHQLRTLARTKKRSYETTTIRKSRVDEMLAQGWELLRSNQTTVRLKREKAINIKFQDRVWSLLYAMDFTHLSNADSEPASPTQESDHTSIDLVDVVGLDREVAVAIVTVANESYQKSPGFLDKVRYLQDVRQTLARVSRIDYPTTHKRAIIPIVFKYQVLLSEEEISATQSAGIITFDEQDLLYYESLLSQVGPAAKYQFLADMLPGKPVPGLAIRVPAVRTKMAGVNCYNFVISPEYLLKISYVSHRAKGRASDVNAYQRMLNRSRLRSIQDYISDDGVFPTNIIINIDTKTDSKRVVFHRVKQETDPESTEASGVFGWLEIRPAYKSAWIIDGQHRLYGYSGHERSKSSVLSVLAFDGLAPSKQAKLFIDINAKQKSVKRSLLQELYAELHWDSDAPEIRVRAIISKAIQELDADPGSALFGRLQMSDTDRDDKRCISFNSIYTELERSRLLIAKEKGGYVVEFGSLWAGSNEATLRRTVTIIKSWLNVIRDHNSDWWNAGAGEGGGLAMNDGIVVLLQVLRSVIEHLESKGENLKHANEKDFVAKLSAYAECVGDYFGRMSAQERKQFRQLRGIQGQTARRRRCQVALHAQFSDYNPQGLEEYLKAEKASTNLKAKEIVDRLEISLQQVVIDELKSEYGPGESQWWMLGVPQPIRIDVTRRYEEENGKRGSKEHYFDLIHYRKIALQNWQLFEPLLGYGKTGNKEKRTDWLNDVNEIRKLVSHASSGVAISIEQLSQLQEYEAWLQNRLGNDESS